MGTVRCMVRITVHVTVRCVVGITGMDTVKGVMRTIRGMVMITVKGMLRMYGKYIIRCTVIITVNGTVTYSYLYPLCASVTLLRHTTNRAAYRSCLHFNVSRLLTASYF